MPAKSISAKELRAAVSKAIEKNKIPNAEVNIAVYPWILGFILRDGPLARKSQAELKTMAKKITTDLGKTLPLAKTGKPATLIHDGHITMGFIPDIPVDTLFER
jgi:hypothetical protein